MDTPFWSDIEGLHELYRNRKTTPSEVVSWYLSRIDKYNPKFNIYLTVTRKEAVDKAKEQDLLLQKDPGVLDKFPLFGIPVAYKDIFMTKGVKTTAGSKVLERHIAQYSGTAVKKLEEAGSILLGKLNCDAWAHGSSGENSDFGPTGNPWNSEYVSGGSSSGSGAALAADLALVTLGTDTGGSIRCPASFCGVVGLKPTYGRVSRYGVIAMASSLDSVGHFTKTVTDSRRVLSVTAGKDLFDATTSPLQIEKIKNLKPTIKNLRLGVPKEYLSHGSSMTEGMEESVVKVTQDAIKTLEKMGAKIVEISLPHTPLALAAYYIIQPAEVSSNLGRFDGIRYGNSRQVFGAEAKRRIMLGTYTLSAGYYDAYYKTAQKVRTLIINDFKKAWENVDLIVGPVMPHPPFKIGDKVDNPLSLYLEDVLTVPVNLAGLPAISLPGGFSQNQLPVGFQLIGPQFSEEKIFALGQLYQETTNWHTQRPQL